MSDLRGYKVGMFSSRLQQAMERGMVVVDIPKQTATILAPPHPENLSDEDWLLIRRAASEIRAELEQLGYKVQG